MCIVCGDDQATGVFAKSSADDTYEEVVDLSSNDDVVPTINSTQVNVSSVISPIVRKHGKRPRPINEFGEMVNKLAEAVEHVAEAVKSCKSNIQEHTSYLYTEVMKSEGFDELTLEAAFDFLNENDKIARSFLVKGADGRYRWLKKFQYAEV